jgi:HEAT repeat protein
LHSAPAFEHALAKIILWITAIEFSLIFLLVVRLFWMRLSRAARDRRRARVMDAWRIKIFEALREENTLPKVSAADVDELLPIWNEYHSLLDGSARDRLNEFARATRLDHAARRMLSSSRPEARLHALTAVSNLRDLAFEPELRRLAKDSDPTLSFLAVKALVRLDPNEGIPLFVQALAGRDDWSTAQVAALLREAGPELHSAALAGVAVTAPPSHRSRVVRYLEVARAQDALPAVRRILETSPDEETICACLLVIARFRNPADLERTRSFLDHSSANVRIRAVTALGRICGKEDLDHLVEMLGDREWWVRYRAAQALAWLPGMNLSQMQMIQAEHADWMAKDIITHVLAEESLK